jgi:phage repressor protein C with HTH and peptisase S24 domain
MAPTLAPGRIVVAVRRHTVRSGDLVIIRHNGQEKIKRIGRLRPGEIFVLGDNAAHSTDSREFGWLGLNAVVGTVIWPRKGNAVADTN